MDPQTIIAVITAAARFLGVSPRAVPCDPSSSETHELAIARRCVITQLSHLGMEDGTIRAILKLSPMDYQRMQRIGKLLSIYPEDVAVHQAIAAAVPGAMAAEFHPIPLSHLIQAAAITGAVHIDEVLRARSGRCNARDFRSAAMLIAMAQHSPQEEITREFRLSSTTTKLSMIKNARHLSTVDVRFCKVIRRILQQATNLVTA